MRIAAPAKTNLFLDILGRRDDGFHDLETVFQTLDLHDTVEVEPLPADRVELTCDDPSLPVDDGNLAFRAARAFRARSGCGGLRVALRKRIPHGAGLGGGSSDAAAVLRAANRLAPRPLTGNVLAGMALDLGSDVPFFLLGGTAHALGRGERLTALPDARGAQADASPAQPVTVLMPQAHLPTPAVYCALRDDERGPRPARGVATWADAQAWRGVLHNRLTRPAVRLCPAVDALLEWLHGIGVPHLLSGSGAACVAFAHLDPPPGVRAWHTAFRPRARLDHVD